MADTERPIADIVAYLYRLADEVDVRLKGGGLALPSRSDREQRIYHHGCAVGIRTAAMEIEKGRTDDDE